MKLLKIGAMADACGVTPRALRHYQEEGILTPELVDDESGYRGYSITQAVKLDMIAQLQSAGFTLREISEIEASKDAAFLRERVGDRIDEIDEKIRELEYAKWINEELARGCDQYLERSMCGTIVLERVPEQRILLFDPPSDEDLGGEGDYTDNERWEWYQQYARRCLAEAGYPRLLFRRVGCYVPQGEICPGMNLLHARPFVFVDPLFSEAYERSVPLQGGMCLTVYYDSCHSEEGQGLDESRLSRLLEHVRDNGYTIAGPFVMENIFRYMRFFNENEHSYFRHRLPVAR